MLAVSGPIPTVAATAAPAAIALTAAKIGATMLIGATVAETLAPATAEAPAPALAPALREAGLAGGGGAPVEDGGEAELPKVPLALADIDPAEVPVAVVGAGPLAFAVLAIDPLAFAERLAAFVGAAAGAADGGVDAVMFRVLEGTGRLISMRPADGAGGWTSLKSDRFPPGSP